MSYVLDLEKALLFSSSLIIKSFLVFVFFVFLAIRFFRWLILIGLVFPGCFSLPHF